MAWFASLGPNRSAICFGVVLSAASITLPSGRLIFTINPNPVSLSIAYLFPDLAI
jgi:hypothetical protein